MTHWDGLVSSSGDRILVLAATNRPFDLDEAIIRRILVGLPPVESREQILRTLLSKEKTENLDFKERKKREEAEKSSEDGSEAKEEASEERVITLRALSMEDMRVAKSQVAASFGAEGAEMNELKQWNELYGEGGSRKKEQLSYFL
ncbi:hypothetical protein N665_0365s0036 [Sinapis alba]|nr:hypothetical protein N665_0365s0036 [Sinapis alba]